MSVYRTPQLWYVKNRVIGKIVNDLIRSGQGAIKIKNSESFMPFNIDHLGVIGVSRFAQGRDNIAFSHYYKHPSGDMIPDPDVQLVFFAVGDEWMFMPYTFQNSMMYREYVEFQSGKFNKRMQNDLAVFVDQWLKNVVEQQGLR